MANTSRPWEQPPHDIQALAKYVQGEWLDPVLRSLRRRAKGDKELLKLLAHVNLWTLTEPRPEWGPNAVATHKDGKPIISVDLMFLNYMSSLANLAGAALTGRDDVGDILYSWGFDYGQSVAQARLNQLATPVPSFNVEHYVTDQGLRVVVERLADEAFLGGVVWTVLHEVAHHCLNHLERYPVSNEEAHEWECKADDWAFSMMEKLGYSLALVHGLLAGHETAQEIRYMAQAEQLETDSSHPSWATRRKELEKHDVYKPPRGDFSVYLTVSGVEPDAFYISETFVPRNQDSEGWLLAIHNDGVNSVFLPFEWKGGEICLYGRAGDTLTEMIIHQSSDLKPEITFREIRMEDGTMYESKTRGFQADCAWSQELSVGPLKAYQVFESSPRKVFAQALRQVKDLREAINTAEQIQLNMLHEVRQILIQYARGHLSLAEAQKEFKASANQASARVQEILEPEGYAKVRDALMSNSIINFGLDQLSLSPKRRESIMSNGNWSREAYWPPISAYDNMDVSELGIEISFIRNDLATFEQSNDPEKRALTVEARNRLNVLLVLYSEKSGRPIEIVKEMYGF